VSDADPPRPIDHDVCIVVAGKRISNWERYEMTIDMMRFDDHFSMAIPFSRELWDLLSLGDQPVKIFIDQSQFIDGFIDTCILPEDEEVIQITGRDRMARVVQESAPGIRFQGMKVNDLIAKLVNPWFTEISNSNAANRLVLRGRGKKAKAGNEPVKLFSQKKLSSLIEPGQTRGTVLQNILNQIGCIAFSQGDGKSLFVGKPNYNQEPQYRFFMPAANSARIGESTVQAMGIHLSTEQRYSEVIVVGSGTGTDENYGPRVASLYGVAKNNALTADGTGADFSAPKRLVVPRQVASKEEATELAKREMGRRDAGGDVITVRVASHGQRDGAGTFFTLFAPDTLASVEDERIGLREIYMLTKCTYRGDRKSGETTSIEMVPKGTELTAA
jgi:prophage tail gpP-like protein